MATRRITTDLKSCYDCPHNEFIDIGAHECLYDPYNEKIITPKDTSNGKFPDWCPLEEVEDGE